jgi:hypothetical protein
MLYPQETKQKSFQPILVAPSASAYQTITFFPSTLCEKAVNISYNIRAMQGYNLKCIPR